MSIDPTSAPIPVARNENSGSNENRRSESQGSATGSKDGQFSSFWDRALSGAQKLFSKASLFDSDKNEESASQNREAKPMERTFDRGDAATLSVVPGFGSPGFHRFSSAFASHIRSDSPERSSSEPTVSEQTDVSGSAYQRDRAEAVDQIANSETRLEERPIQDPVLDDEEKSAAEQSANTPSPASNAKSVGIINLLPVDNQQVTESNDRVGINSAKHAADMPSKLQSPNSPAHSGSARADVERPIVAVKELGDGQPTMRNVDGANSQQASHGLKGQVKTAGTNQSIESGRASSDSVQGKEFAEEPKIQSKSGASDSLRFDLAKARKSISTALDPAQGGKSSVSGQVSQGTANPSATQASSQLSATDPATAKSSDFENGGTRGSEEKSSRQESRNPSVAISRNDATKGSSQAPVSVDSAAVEANAAKRNAETIESQLHRAFRGAEASSRTTNAGAQTQSGQNATKKLGGIANPNPRLETARSTDAGNQLRMGDKVDGDVAKSGEFSIKASRSKGDSSQGLSAGELQSASKTRVSSFTKPQQIGYASKSTSETKQVYEALVKSVDRLVANKNDSISVKINFDGGGMLKLRVSMDSGRVNSIMQTDLSGLESMIKSSWTELSNELNQRGIKLNAPQFSNTDSQGNRESATYDSLNKEANSEGGEAKDSKRNRSEDQLPSDSRKSAFSKDRKEAIDGTDEGNREVVADDQELKTYA